MTQIEHEIVDSLRRIVRSIDLYSRSLSREYELTWPQLAALRELERLKKCPVGRLAAEMYVGAPTVTGIVDRLERNGLVKRIREEDDRRKVLVALTDEGRRLLSRNPYLLDEGVCRQLADLPERQQKQMLTSLNRLVSMMEAEQGNGSGGNGD
ncbi:MAG: MarR family transcriptional regulator [Planctomycetota bacterium]|nr:MAG: MarR family transcriptional regulator [Planctomycetota bacterium]REJ88546.1 MAG: MarR family transcriptional regulator [Planctomycetota bacterium]REK22143.1 MAG: MarR family transcriptional regulator [Planctomycetota bacterium]REK34954.1 MAG: MarR family transcriptional regulator [Planctomycetota bacterium]